MKTQFKEKSISELYHFELDEKSENQKDWLVKDVNRIISLTPDKISPEDVAVLVRQGFVPDFAFPKAAEFLEKNPLAGEMYEGELLDSVAESKADINKYKSCLLPLIEPMKEFGRVHVFELLDFKDDFLKSVAELAKRLN